MSKLPKFEELTPERVNDLIATKVMEWRRDERFSLSWYSGETPQKIRFYENMLLDWASDDQPDSSDIFDPYSDLNDCYLFEEKIKEGGFTRMALYVDHLDALNSRYQKGGSYHGGRQFNLIHTSAEQKCRAILTALNLCE